MTEPAPFASGLIPYTDAERRADEEARRVLIWRGVARRLAAPRGSYDQPGTAQSRERDLRIMGESA